MEIFPAIDLKGGNVVRLFQGDYEQVTVYNENPAQIAELFRSRGARNLHLVDLDGAKDGKPVNFSLIKNLTESGGFFIEVGGGIRNEKQVEDYLNIGVNRVILGTVVVDNFAFLESMLAKYGEKIAVGVDARGGRVAINGWREITDIMAVDFCRKLRDAGVSTVIYTDIERDGTLEGTNMSVYKQLSEIDSLNIIASGGISFEEEITLLCEMKIHGAIVGKAIYAGMLDLSHIIKLADKN